LEEIEKEILVQGLLATNHIGDRLKAGLSILY
jgi:hypothetical protein